MQGTSIHSARRMAAVLVLAFAGAMVHPSMAQVPAVIPTAAFFQNPAIGAAKLSPSGRYIALNMAPKDGRLKLIVMDTFTLAAKSVADFDDVDVRSFRWISDDRIVYSASDQTAGAAESVFLPGGTSAVDRDGNRYRLLGGFVAPTRKKASDDVFVLMPDIDIHRELHAYNIARRSSWAGPVTHFPRPGKTRGWLMDANDVPRVATTYDKGQSAVHYLDPATEKWRELIHFDPLKPEGFKPLFIGSDGTLFVAAYNGRDTEALYRYDLAAGKLDADPIVSLPGFDFDGEFIVDSTGSLVGIRYVSDAESTIWFDAKLKALQASIDSKFPATINRLEIAEHGEVPIVLIHSFSDVDPGTFMLFNTQTGKFTMLGANMRGIDSKQMAHKELHRFKARDGMEIPAWLTLPRNSSQKNLPLVVLVHGGPDTRGAVWEWSAAVQFLAARGYAVLQPEFRGGEGFGFRHLSAGWKQWGLAMQTDVSDAARWAVAKGIADPARICIGGSNYGGYATLMGLITEPDLFRCGFEWGGMTDINMMFEFSTSNLTTTFKNYTLKVTVGDPEKDSAQLKVTSPLLLAAKLKQPLLIGHGGADRLVPIDHGIKFKNEVSKTNSAVEWVEYTSETNRIGAIKNRLDYWTRVEKFLDRNIGAK